MIKPLAWAFWEQTVPSRDQLWRLEKVICEILNAVCAIVAPHQQNNWVKSAKISLSVTLSPGGYATSLDLLKKKKLTLRKKTLKLSFLFSGWLRDHVIL